MTDNIRPIDTGKPDARRAALENLKRVLESSETLQEAITIARFRKIQLDAYVGAGFTREEALKMVMGMPA